MIDTAPTPIDWLFNREARARLAQESLRFPHHLVEVPTPPPINPGSSQPLRSWRSRRFLVILWQQGPHQWLTVQRCKVRADGQWEDGITWDDLLRLKAEAGLGDRWAVELFPADDQVVNVANMRHLFLLPGPPPFAWKVTTPCPASAAAVAPPSGDHPFPPASPPTTTSPSSPTTPASA